MMLNGIDFEIEDISPEEADRVVRTLRELERSVSSLTIGEYLHECAASIHFLVHDDDGDLTAAA